MKIIEILKRMFIERYCVVCTEPISYDKKDPFCDACLKDWEEFVSAKCGICGRERGSCTCLPSNVKKINHSMVSWCYFYNGEENGEINELFKNLKWNYDGRVIDFCTDKMKESLLHLCRSRGVNYKDFVVTYVPRNERNVYKYGFDQSEKLAKSLAKKLGIGVIKTFENFGTKEQKKLNKKERVKNALEAYEYIEDSVGDHKRFFLVDDILTTGSTMLACSYQLFKNGVTEVVPVVFAKDNFKIKGDRRNVKRNTKYYFTRALKGFK